MNLKLQVRKKIHTSKNVNKRSVFQWLIVVKTYNDSNHSSTGNSVGQLKHELVNEYVCFN